MDEPETLVDLANRDDVKSRHSGGLADLIAGFDVDEVVGAYRRTTEGAPNRVRRGKRFMVYHSNQVPGEIRRCEEHLAIAMVADSVEIAVDDERVVMHAYQVPLYEAQSSHKVRAMDLLGYGAQRGTVWVTELKANYDSGLGDSPLRALLEALTYTAMLDRSFGALVDELPRLPGTTPKQLNPNTLVAANRDYWTLWNTASAAGDWLPALLDLTGQLEAALDRTIALVDLGDVKPVGVGRRPHVGGDFNPTRIG